MTLLTLIRNLHENNMTVLDYDLYISDNSALDMEDVVDQTPGCVTAEAMISPAIPPQYIELGDKPRYLYVESLAEYLRLTHAKERIPKRFPHLLVAVFTDRSGGFLPRYKGKPWREIPPIELMWLTNDDMVLPVLDAAGTLIDLCYDNELALMEPATYYLARSEWGSEFAWQGDLAKDKLPTGLRLIEK